MYILGISAYYHDSAACLLKNGEIIAAAQEERFTRKKYDANFPINSINYCLKEAGIQISNISYISYYEKPLIKFTRLLENYLHYSPKVVKSFIKAIQIWIRKKIWIEDHIEKTLGYKGKIIFPEHHESHAASAFFPSPYNKAAILTIDAVGEWTTASYGVGKDNNIKILSELRFPHSLGLLYSAFTYFTGFKVNSGEYKLMGLAPYGKPKYKDKILKNIVDLKDDGSFRLDMKFFDYAVGLKMTSKKFNELFDGPPRKKESELTQREMDIARSIQEVTEQIVLRMAKHVKKETGEDYLCLAGGVALNCVANGKLLRSGLFKDIWIQPASGDAGGALGAALFAYCKHLKKPRPIKNGKDLQGGSYLGPSYSDNKIEKFLTKNNLPYKKTTDEEKYNIASDLIQDEKVIGWFQGRMEFGPRALGNRSIIGDSRSPKMQKKINLKIKFREGFRPFAPSVLSEKAHEWFDLKTESPYMLLTADVKKDKLKQLSEEEKNMKGMKMLEVVRSQIPAVTHIDNSARIQTVSKETNPEYHKLISTFFQKTGCPIIINTSFNVRGEPIVASPEDAYRCFMRTEMDVLILGNFILHKEGQPKYNDNIKWSKIYELD
jgi:carbamoyltransferase